MIGALLGLPGKVNTLLARLTSVRAALLDNLNATVSSRAAAATALSTAQWTNALATALLKASGMGLLVPPKASGIGLGTDLINFGVVQLTSNTVAGVVAQAGGQNLVTAVGSSTSYADAVNYTGSGVIDFCAFLTESNWAGDFEVIIDTVTVFSGTVAAGKLIKSVIGGCRFVATLNTSSNWDNWLTVNGEPIPFYTSLQVRYKRGAGASTVTDVGVALRYRKTT